MTIPSFTLRSMLERFIHSNSVVTYRSRLLSSVDVPHGFSTRIGGLSRGAFESLNLGNPNGCPVQDDEANIAQNYQRLETACGLAGRRRCFVHQVHGNEIAEVESADRFDNSAKADALMTLDPRTSLSIRTADCVPILLATADGSLVAAVHAGWRGVVAKVVTQTVAAMKKRSPLPLIAAIGPCISQEAFEVGPEVAAEFTQLFGEDAPIVYPSDSAVRPAKPHIDLRQAVKLQLLAANLPADQIDTTDCCTFRDSDEFFSHRRENGVTGRMAAMIGGK
jgi:YfiH family protein